MMNQPQVITQPRSQVSAKLSSGNESSSNSSNGTGAAATLSTSATFGQSRNTQDRHWQRLRQIIHEDEIADLKTLRELSWYGMPPDVRPTGWKLLLGYLQPVRSKREAALEKKRQQYEHLVQRYFNNRCATQDDVYRQIHIDIPRMQPLLSIFQQEIVQKIFERILFIWSVRHPASGYVQGMNDLVTPFFVTFLAEHIPGHQLENVERLQIASLPDQLLRDVEADAFWSFSTLLDTIQENYTFGQLGIQRLVNLLERLTARIDQQLHEHLCVNSVQYLHFSFRWMNNLLIRELPLRCIIRLWDCYFSQSFWASTSCAGSGSNTAAALRRELPNDAGLQGSPEAGSTSSPSLLSDDKLALNTANGTPFGCSFHLYVCAAFLKYWSKQLLKEKDFQGLMIFLQNLPTDQWAEQEISLIVADAYLLKYTYTANHLK